MKPTNLEMTHFVVFDEKTWARLYLQLWMESKGWRASVITFLWFKEE